MVLIVGTGSHSRGGKAVIKPHIKRFVGRYAARLGVVAMRDGEGAGAGTGTGAGTLILTIRRAGL